MMLNLIAWYLVVALAGWLVFPLAYRVFAFLPDRGLALTRPLGLLLWGYAYWLLVSLKVLQNDAGGALFALLLVAGLSLWPALRQQSKPLNGWGQVTGWLRAQRGLVLSTELLFLAMFVLFAVVRAANPDASGTEKPMELAFINAILRSPAFPPSDPWLSGYAISYYYFGYVMVALLARLTGAPGSLAFNLALITWFALTGLAAYGLLYNLLALRGKAIAGQARARLAALLAPLFLLLVSNLEGFLEMLHARGLFWQQAGAGSQRSAFWSWLNIQELVQPPTPPLSWAPERATGIWWWRASRVLQDFDLGNQPREIIDEFPMFSYLLGDLHPHLLAMPFVLLALGLALNAFLRVLANRPAGVRVERWWGSPEFWLAAVALGGLAFLNTWDFPIYVALFAAAVALAGILHSGWRWQLVFDFGEVLLSLGLFGVLLYLPFYLGFASQANGLLPSLIFFTRGVYFWVMFGALLLPLLAWMLWLAWKKHRSGLPLALGQGVLFAGGLIAALWLLSFLWGVQLLQRDPGLAGVYGAANSAALLPQALSRRLASPGAWLTLFGVLLLTWALIGARRRQEAPQEETAAGDAAGEARADAFVLLLVLLGAGLALFPEFFYLRDLFGWRMNTIFKFYFQTWIVWALAAAYASAVLLQAGGENFWLRRAGALAWVVLVGMALAYPFFGIWTRTNGFNPTAWTLDGAAYLDRYNPQEMEAIRWLQQAPYGVVAEAVGGSYSGYARVSMLTGLPAVLGWPGHESQWRGGVEEMGTREADIALLYRAKTWEPVEQVLAKYQIRYVFVGTLEQGDFRPNAALYQQHLQVAFHNETATVYEVPHSIVQPSQAGLP